MLPAYNIEYLINNKLKPLYLTVSELTKVVCMCILIAIFNYSHYDNSIIYKTVTIKYNIIQETRNSATWCT
jgi:hypothetical protein